MNEWNLSGAGRFVLGFIAGALFALLAAYYFYIGRDAAIRDLPQAAQNGSPTRPQPSGAAGPNPSNTAVVRFASRMTYELSRVPAEPPAPQPKPPAAEPATASPHPKPTDVKPTIASTPAKPPAAESTIASPGPKSPAVEPTIDSPPAKAAAETTIASPQPKSPATAPAIVQPSDPSKASRQSVSRAPPDEVSTSRIANARPISATPPDPRDTTRAIEKETRLERREPGPSLPGVKPEAVQPRYVEGRDLVIPPKTTVATRSGIESSSAADTEIESRLAATRNWLSAAAPTTHTIQILGTSNQDQLKAHLRTLGKLLEPGQIYVFRTVAQGKPSMTVVYGAYADRQAALQALQKLPDAVTMNRPVLRTVKGIRAETAQHKTDS